jgi:hypothetical protein
VRRAVRGPRREEELWRLVGTGPGSAVGGGRLMLQRRDMARLPRVRATFLVLAVAALVAVGAWTLSAAGRRLRRSPRCNRRSWWPRCSVRCGPSPASPGTWRPTWTSASPRSPRPAGGEADGAARNGVGAWPPCSATTPSGVELLGRLPDLGSAPDGERSIFVDAATGQAWAWDWQSFTATRLASGAPGHRRPRRPRWADGPRIVAERALQAITPTTSVTIGAARARRRPSRPTSSSFDRGRPRRSWRGSRSRSTRRAESR